MSSDLLPRIWLSATPTGTQRMVLTVLAFYAGYGGIVAMPVREVAKACGVSKTAAAKAIDALCEAGRLALVAGGGGPGNPSRYRVVLGAADVDNTAPDPQPDRSVRVYKEEIILPAARPAKAPEPPAVPKVAPAKPPAPQYPVAHGLPSSEVGMILTAAGVKSDMREPFYWHSRSHDREASELIAFAGGLDRVIDILPRVRVPDPFRRISALRPLIAKALTGAKAS